MTPAFFETFGKYRLRERLAFGGMAEVFLGTVHGEAGFIKPVVIKRLHPRISEDDEFVQMLIDEARITSQLTHSNICQVLDLGSVKGSYYIAMEYISGEDLRTIQDFCQRRGFQLPIPAALYIVAEVLAGLDYAHRKTDRNGKPLAIIHRDVSPQNILVTYEGEVKVIDFGIAKARSRLVQTEAGVIKGKFRYMSPEQASGAKIDQRTDIFAAGVVLYELLRGEPHSMNISDTEVLRRMRKATFEPLHKSRPEISPEVEQVVNKALALKAGNRYETAEIFRATLLRQLQELGGPFGRMELASLMSELFDQERRQRRNPSFANTDETTQPPLRQPRDPKRSTVDLPEQRQAPVAPAANPGEAGLADRADPPTDKWVAYAATQAMDSGEHGPQVAPIETLPTNEVRPPWDGPSAPVAAGTIADDDEETDPRQDQATDGPRQDGSGEQTRLRSPSELSARRTQLRADDLSDRRTLLQEDLSGRQTRLQPDLSGQATRQRTDLSDRQTHLRDDRRSSSPSGYSQWESDPAGGRATTPPRRDRISDAGRFTRGDFQPDFRRQPTESLTLQPPSAAPSPGRPPRPGPAETDGARRSETARTRRPRRAGIRTAVGIFLVVMLGTGLAVGISYLDKLGLIFVEDPEPDSSASWPGAASGLPGVRPPDAGAGGPTATALPKRPMGQIRVSSVPAGARVVVDGKPTGKVTPTTVNAPVGEESNLELVLEGYETYQMPVEPRESRMVTIVATLRKRSAGTEGLTPPSPPKRRRDPSAMPEGTGVLRLTSIRESVIYINGHPTGRTPRLDVPLAPGTYSVKAYFPGVERFTAAQVVVIRVGQTSRLHFDPPQ